MRLGGACGYDGSMYGGPVTPVMTSDPMALPPAPYAPDPNPTQSPYPYPYVPKPTNQVMPTMVGTAQMVANVPEFSPDLAPQDLLRPLPSIVDNQPVVVAQCDSFAQWVDQNPLLAGGLLLGLAFVVFKKK